MQLIFFDEYDDVPGVAHRITRHALPVAFDHPSAARVSPVLVHPGGEISRMQSGFEGELLTTALDQPQPMLTAADDNISLAGIGANRLVGVLPTRGGLAEALVTETFTSSLKLTSGLALVLANRPAVGMLGGAFWSDSRIRADVPECMLDGGSTYIIATELLNRSADAIEPVSRTLWCVAEEREGLGDNLPSDWVTRVEPGSPYARPWFYVAVHAQPCLNGERHDASDRITLPDALIQAHPAALGIVFYDEAHVPREYRGEGFVALGGSWNRTQHTDYKIARLHFQAGRPIGIYKDVLTGFIASNKAGWRGPAKLAGTRDGSLMREDGDGPTWRATYWTVR